MAIVALPTLNVPTSLGTLVFRFLSIGTIMALVRDDPDQTLGPKEFVDLLLEKSGALEERPMTADQVSALTDADRTNIVSEMLAAIERRESQQSGESDSWAVRNEGEADEAYLARLLRSMITKHQDAMGVLANSLGLTEKFRSIAGSSLFENLGRSQSVFAALAGTEKAILSPTTRPSLNIPVPPPNPAHKTNELLAEQAAVIVEMRQIAEQTAEMHRSLNEVALRSLDHFLKGAESSRKSARNAIIVALIGLVVSLLGVGAQIYQTNEQRLEQSSAKEKTVKKEQDRQSELDVRRENTAALARNAAAIEKQNTLLENRERAVRKRGTK